MATKKNLKTQLEEARAELLLLREQISSTSKGSPHQAAASDLSSAVASSANLNTNSLVMGINEVKILISEFDPQHNNMSACSWVKNIEKLKSIHLWTDQATLFYASLRLGGPARHWYNAMENEIQNWEAFKISLVKSFPGSQDDGDVLFRIMTRKKQPHECIENYFYEIIGLAKLIRLSDDSIMKYLISGLDNNQLKGILLASNCKNLDDFLIQIKRFENIEMQTRNRQRIADLSENQPRVTGNLTVNKAWYRNNDYSRKARKEGNNNSFHKNKPYDRDNEVGKKIENRKCFICSEPGHLANRCSKKLKVCFKCKREGHIAKDCCVKTVLNIVDADYGYEVHPNDEYHPVVKVGGKRIIAYLDLGSSCSTIKEGILRSFGWEIEASTKVLKGFGGHCIKAVGKTYKKLELLGQSCDIEFIVVQDEVQDVPVIVGNNFFGRSDLKIIKSAGKFEIERTPTVYNSEVERRNIERDDIIINLEAGDEDSNAILTLANEFRRAFALKMEEIGRTNLVEMEISINKGAIINYRPYKIAYGLKDVLKSNIDTLLKLGIIRPSKSQYSSPVLLVPKKNGEYRMCVDYRKLNSVTNRENFPVPNIEETLNSLANKKYFTNLDLMSGYHQIPIAENSKHLTAFITSEGLYEYNCVPFGLTNAPAVFMRLMRILRDEVGSKDFMIYMDDLLISSSTIEEHFVVLQAVLIKIMQMGLTLNLTKCSFLQTKIEFLGHEISSEGIKPGTAKISDVRKFKTPRSVSEVRQFLGLSGYFRRFVLDFASKAKPLTQLLKKEAQFIWNEEQENAFTELKEILSNRPLLELYDFQKNHELHTDASSHGLAGILMQEDRNGNLKPVFYFSRATTEAESKYHSYELEALAVVESLERFKHYLLHKHFKIITDCNSLRLSKEKKSLIPRIARWWLKIAEYDFELVYRSNKKMTHVDALSRCPMEMEVEAETVAEKILIVGIDTEDWLSTLQREDEYLRNIKECLDGTSSNKNGQKDKFNNFVIKQGRIYKKCEGGDRFVVPNGVRWRVIKLAHDDMGHAGVDRTVEYVRRYFWFPSMKHTVRKYVSSCIECLYNKRAKDETNFVLHVVPREPVPFNTIHIDHVGPFPKSKGGNVFIIGIVCSFTKFLIIKPVRNTSTRLVTKLLDEVTQYFGMPTRIISDRGAAFTSKEFKTYCEENMIKHIATAVKTPRGNGQIERYFRTVRPAIAAMTKEVTGKDWDRNIAAIQWGINSLKHGVTGKTPQELVMGYTPKTILKNKLLLALQEDQCSGEEENPIPMETLREKINEKVNRIHVKRALKFNEDKTCPITYKEGDLVLIKSEPLQTGEPRKLQPRFKGPYQIKSVLSNDRYLVTDTDTTQITQKPYESVQAADRLKPWCRLEDLDFDMVENQNYGDGTEVDMEEQSDC